MRSRTPLGPEGAASLEVSSRPRAPARTRPKFLPLRRSAMTTPLAVSSEATATARTRVRVWRFLGLGVVEDKRAMGSLALGGGDRWWVPHRRCRLLHGGIRYA